MARKRCVFQKSGWIYFLNREGVVGRSPWRIYHLLTPTAQCGHRVTIPETQNSCQDNNKTSPTFLKQTRFDEKPSVHESAGYEYSARRVRRRWAYSPARINTTDKAAAVSTAFWAKNCPNSTAATITHNNAKPG